MHTCPMSTGPVPHVGGPILPPGAPTVLINFLPAATVTSMAVCVGPPDVIVKGSAGVLINFLPAARMGDQTAHGGVIILGSPNVIIGEIGSPSPGAGGMGGIVAGLVTSLGLDKAVASIYNVAAGAIDAATKKLLELGGEHLAGTKPVQNLLKNSKSSGTQQQFDGKVIGAGCAPSDSNAVGTAKGIRPAKCSDPGKTIPKVYFANGINTKLYGDGASMCDSMQKIADQTCAEVVGIYGAAEGMLPDVNQAVQEIQKNADSPQVTTLTRLMTDALATDPPSPVNIIAHSRGGLATQQAIANTKLSLAADMPPGQVDQALSNVSVSAYGTAEQGWPVGPEYTKLNNSADPVPGVIQGAQKAFPNNTFSDSDTTPTVHINDPKLNPINAHSLDNVYISQMGQAEGARDCNCS